ncbi:MAG: PorT family protein [Bacteroidetes bacterium]|nr:PorT family protein [Bacteroidota bacterium]
MKINSKTKHIFLVFIFFCIFLSITYAQKENNSQKRSQKEFFAFGPKISINITNEWIHQKGYTEFLPGADLGLFFRFSISRLYLQHEINYVIRNQSNTRGYVTFPCPTNEYKSHHLDIPVLVGVKAIDFKLFKIRFFAGPEFCVKFKDHISKNDFQLGFQLGSGVDIWRFTIDASYSFLGNIHPNFSGHNNIVKVGVGFKCY